MEFPMYPKEDDERDLVRDHLGREMTGQQIVRQLAAMLGWGNTPPWHVLERDLAA